jgi:2-polyprenyl-3-methyl-5-hydroxy-6-metoxy-1,4-benzoquinol methylase
VHKLPRAPVGDRIELLRAIARDKRTIDLGFIDQGRMSAKRAEGTWLHAELKEVARELVGIDLDRDGVAQANELGYEALSADCQDRESLTRLDLEPAEVVIAGELIEHLDRPGAFLDAVKVLVAPNGVLVLTTPNSISLTNFLAALVGRELLNPDHVGWQSPRTAETLLRRHGWELRDRFFYRFPPVREDVASQVTRRQVAVFTAYQALARPLFRIRPWLADGLLLVAELRP